MRHARRVRRGRTAYLLALVLGACASPPSPVRRDTTVHATPPRASAERPHDPGAQERSGRTRLVQPPTTELDFAIEPVGGGRSVLFVSQHAGEGAAFARRQTDRGRGPVVTVTDGWIWGAFDAPDGTWVLVTSDGSRLCFERRQPDAVEATARGCAAVAPSAIALAGDRIALVDAAVERPPAPPKAAQDPPRKPPRSKGPRKKTKAAKKKKATKSSTPPRPPAPKSKVDVRLRWASLDGVVEAESRPTGLVFKRPQEGLTVIDAAGRANAVDLLWASWVEPRNGPKKPGPLGTARLVAGSLDASGAWDPRTETTIVTTDLVWGGVDGHNHPRLAGTADATAYLARVGKGPTCRAAIVAPAASGSIGAQDAVCGADPWRLSSREPVAPAELSVYERLLGEGAKRAAAQLKSDVARAAWTSERGFWLAGERLRSIARKEGNPRDEQHPFAARRSRVAWGAFDASGLGLAAVDGRLFEVDAGGTSRPLASDAPEWAVRAPEPRARVARIGRAWWTARGDVARLFPEPLSPEPLRGRGHPDATALVGGATSGVLLELVGGRLDVSSIGEDGGAVPLARAPAPVRHGFDAVARRGGGALVAGVDVRDATRVVAIVVDERGTMRAPVTTTLPIRAGELGVRLAPLPRGGAWLSDAAGKRVVWLDDDGREVGAAAWPADASRATCVDGSPARTSVPSMEPGKLVRAPALAVAGTCAIDHPVWAPDGSVRAFVSAAEGTDATAEVAILRLASPADVGPGRPVAAAPSASPSPPPPACPPDMVAVTSTAEEAPAPFCVDRFEAMLVDDARGVPLSPDHSTVPHLLDFALGEWVTGRQRTGDVHARAMPLPLLPAGQRGANPRAVSRMGVRPSGYVTGHVAAAACAAAGKRLCSADEFLVACRGEQDLMFPYGDTFEDRACNVFRDDHPAAILHGNASLGHLDPRLNRVRVGGETMLRATGATPRCASRWGADAVYDMVGNLDEWVDEPGGAFAGGFYSRSTRAGCEAIITAHPRQYLDYSTGVRCCKALGRARAGEHLP